MRLLSLSLWRTLASVFRFLYANRSEPALWFFVLILVEAVLIAAIWLLTRFLESR